MKTYKSFSFLILFITATVFSFAQEVKTETIKVSGNCGMCKTRIEKAAKTAGAESAEWSADTKMLTVTYNSGSTDAGKIQQAVAAAGHDTQGFKAKDAVYNKLPGCCKYDRTKQEEKASSYTAGEKKCCDDEKKCGMDCCKGGKCDHKEAHAGQEGKHQQMNCPMMQQEKKGS